MDWNEALRDTLRDIISEKNAKVTYISEQAGQNKNFLTRFFKGAKPSMSLDEVEAVSRALGFEDIVEFLKVVEKKKILFGFTKN